MDTPRFTNFEMCDAYLQIADDSKIKYKSTKPIHHDELVKHSQSSDMWAIFDNKVYDVTNYVSRHPELVSGFTSFIGKDATQVLSQIQPFIKGSIFFKSEYIGPVQ